MSKPNAQLYAPDPAYLRQLWRATGLSQSELAARLGISVRVIRYYFSTDPKAHQPAPYLFQFALEMLASPDESLADARRTLGLLLKSNGGTLRITPRAAYDLNPQRAAIERDTDPVTGDVVYRLIET